jgi:hypothetical protein
MKPMNNMNSGTTTKAGERTHTFVPWVITKELNNAWRHNFMRPRKTTTYLRPVKQAK